LCAGKVVNPDGHIQFNDRIYRKLWQLIEVKCTVINHRVNNQSTHLRLYERSKSFEALAKRIFKRADVHGHGRIDSAELFVCILLIYDT
jgi:hypothetical protein